MELIDLVWELAAIPDEQRQQKLASLKAQATQKGDQELLNVISQYESTSESEIQQMMSEENTNTTKRGSSFNWGALASGVGSAVTDVTDMIGKIQGNDAKAKADSYIKNINTQLSSSMPRATSYDDLAKQWSNSADITSPDKYGFGYVKPGKAITGALSAGARGAATGAQIGGGIGAAVGAVASAGVNIIGTLFGNQNAKKQADLVKQKAQQANNFKAAGFQNNAYNIGNSRMANMQTNWIALGGPLQGAVEYDFMQQSLLNEQQRMNNYTNRITSMPNSFMNEFALGGQSNGGYFSNGLTYIGEGGTHEQNPHEGVLIGYDEQGTPNLVEEGEYIWNDYVFSNRLKVPKEVKNMFGLGGKKSGYTFAEAVDFIQKESEERPNDPISANALEVNLAKLAQIQEVIRQKQAQQQQQQSQKVNRFAPGGTLTNALYEPETYKIDPSIFGTLVGGKYNYGDQWYTILGELKQHPEYLKDILQIGRTVLDKDSTVSKESEMYKFYDKLFKHKALSKYRNLKTDLSNEFIDGLYNYYTDANPGVFHDLAAVAAKVYDISPEVFIRFMQDSNNNGQLSRQAVMYEGKPLTYKGTKKDFSKWLKEVDATTALSNREKLKNAGIDIPDNVELIDLNKKVNSVGDSTGTQYFMNTEKGVPRHRIDGDQQIKTSQLGLSYDDDLFEDTNLKDTKKYNAYQVNLAAPKEVKQKNKEVIHVLGADGNYEILEDPTQLMENDLYNGYAFRNSVTKDGELHKYYGPQTDRKLTKYPGANIAMAAPAIGTTVQGLTDLLGITNKPDYTEAQQVFNSANNLNEATYTPIGNYMTYNPLSIDYISNKLASQAEANRRSIANNSGLNRGTAIAGMLASDYNYQNAIGDAIIKANQSNFDNQYKVNTFNRETDSTNSQGFLSASQANMANNALRMQAIKDYATLRQAERQAIDTAKSANYTNMLDQWGEYGKYLKSLEMVMNNKANLYNPFTGEFLDEETNKPNTGKEGGFLTIKRRR